MKPGYFLFVLLLVLSSSVNLLAQSELKFDIINIDDGLSSSAIHSVLQDSQGYMWFATRDGLDKYDGVQIEAIRFSEKSNVISSLIEATDGTLWVAVLGAGLVNFDPQKIEFNLYENIKSDSFSLRSNNVTFIHQDQQGDIWVSTDLGGLEKLNGKTGKFKTYLNDSRTDLNITYFHESDSGRILVGSDRGILNLYDPSNDKFIPFSIGEDKDETINSIFQIGPKTTLVGSSKGLYVFDNNVRKISRFGQQDVGNVTAIWKDVNADVWIAAGQDLWKLDIDKETFNNHFMIPDHHLIPRMIDKNVWNYVGNRIYQTTANESPVVVDFENRFWMVTNEGLDIYLPAIEVLKRVRVDDSFTNFNRNQVSSSLVDNAGTLWFGTIGGGVNKYISSNFRHYKYKKDIPNSLGSSGVLSFHENEDGTIWVGCNGGNFNLFNPFSETFQRFQIPGSNSAVFDIVQTDDENLWLATSGAGLVNYNIKNGEFWFYRNDPLDSNSISSNNTHRIFLDSQGNMWIGTDNGLNLFDVERGKFERIDLVDNNDRQLNVFVIEQNDQSLWLGTLGSGLVELNLADYTQFKIFNAQTMGDDLLSDFITSICYGQNEHTLWAGTYGGGLINLNLDSKEHKIVSTKDGLLNNVIYSILDDEEGDLWLTSNSGIFKYDKLKQEVIATFDIYDGLQSNEFNRNSGLLASNGMMLVGGVNGFNYFDPISVIRRPFNPSMVFTSFKIFDEPAPHIQSKIQMGEESILLPFDQNSISIGFAMLDFRNPTKNQYRYRMRGLSDHWTLVSSESPIANLTSLDPGEYVFELIGANSDGIWMPNTSKLYIEISPPFWLTWWFRTIVLIMILWIPFSRIKRLQIQKKRLNKLVIERTRLIQSQNHELSTKNGELQRNAKKLNSANEKVNLSNKELGQTLRSLQETQSQLVESEKMASLGVLLAGVGHEINNPLNFIRGSASALFEKINTKKKVDNYELIPLVQIIDKGVDRVANIVKSLSQFSRKGIEMAEECDLESIIENCLVILESKLKNRIEVTKNFSKKKKIITGNGGRLHQVFLNILSNSAQAIPKNGKIEISIKSEDKKIQISITDNGVGIEKENLNRIMNPFFTTKPPGEGTGLGLSITYSIISEHKGHISLDSEVGKGTTFKIVFPL